MGELVFLRGDHRGEIGDGGVRRTARQCRQVATVCEHVRDCGGHQVLYRLANGIPGVLELGGACKNMLHYVH